MDIVSRREWGARPPKDPPTHENWPFGVDLWVHHTAGAEPDNSEELTEIRAIQNFHMDTRGWDDIGYNYLVADDGTIYEGRGFEIHGAHSPGKNHQPAVSLMGNYAVDIPSDAEHRSVYELLHFLNAGDLRGHRENSPTTCPGDAAFKKIVQGPPPSGIDQPIPKFYFEELSWKNGGFGPVIAGAADGYLQPQVRDLKLNSMRDMDPKGVYSTLQDEGGRYFIYKWLPGTWGDRFRFGPWDDEATRTLKLKAREKNTGRTMRPFNGRGHSLYPYPK